MDLWVRKNIAEGRNGLVVLDHRQRLGKDAGAFQIHVSSMMEIWQQQAQTQPFPGQISGLVSGKERDRGEPGWAPGPKHRADYVDDNKSGDQSPKIGNQMKNKFQTTVLRKAEMQRQLPRQGLTS